MSNRCRGNYFRRRLVALVFPLLTMGGCTGLEPALIGAAASGVSAGSSVMSMGKIESAWIATFDQVITACQAACGDLGLSLIESRGDVEKGRWRLVAVDEKGDRHTITVIRETSKLSRFRIDVGLFGPRPVARLLLKRIGYNLYELGLEDGGEILMDN